MNSPTFISRHRPGLCYNPIKSPWKDKILWVVRTRKLLEVKPASFFWLTLCTSAVFVKPSPHWCGIGGLIRTSMHVHFHIWGWCKIINSPQTNYLSCAGTFCCLRVLSCSLCLYIVCFAFIVNVLRNTLTVLLPKSIHNLYTAKYKLNSQNDCFIFNVVFKSMCASPLHSLKP